MNRIREFIRLNWVYVIGVILLLIVAFFFYWGESYFQINRKINDDKIANFATSIGAIISSITLFLLVKQLGEMQKAKEAAYHPDIFSEKGYFNKTLSTREQWDEWERYEEMNGKSNYQDDDYYFDEDSDSIDYSTHELEFVNLGNGIALNIMYTWEYDMHLMLKELKEKIPKYSWKKTDIFNKGEVGHLTPNSKLLISVPWLYFQWLSTCKITEDKITPILKITYSDKFGKLCAKRFEIQGEYSIDFNEDNLNFRVKVGKYLK